MSATFARGLTYGYVRGAAEELLDALRHFGLSISVIATRKWFPRPVDIRCHRRRAQCLPVTRSITTPEQPFLDFVSQGGTLIVQYQAYGYELQDFAPYPFTYATHTIALRIHCGGYGPSSRSILSLPIPPDFPGRLRRLDSRPRALFLREFRRPLYGDPWIQRSGRRTEVRGIRGHQLRPWGVCLRRLFAVPSGSRRRPRRFPAARQPAGSARGLRLHASSVFGRCRLFSFMTNEHSWLWRGLFQSRIAAPDQSLPTGRVGAGTVHHPQG